MAVDEIFYSNEPQFIIYTPKTKFEKVNRIELIGQSCDLSVSWMKPHDRLHRFLVHGCVIIRCRSSLMVGLRARSP